MADGRHRDAPRRRWRRRREMTALLASVRSADEARTALSAGAGIIDAKEPAAGALGAVDATTLAAIVAAVARRRPVSATVGDVPFDFDLLHAAVARTIAAGVDFVKIGMFDTVQDRDARATALRLQRAFPSARLVAVILADRRPMPEWVPMFGACGWHGVMLDTADKARGSLRDQLSPLQLARFALAARSAGLLFGLAGSLREDDIEPLLPLRPDYLGFRGALTAGRGRDRPLLFDAVARIETRIGAGRRRAA